LSDQCFKGSKLGDGIAIDDFNVTGFQKGDRQSVFVMQRVADTVQQSERVFERLQQLRCVDEKGAYRIPFGAAFPAFRIVLAFVGFPVLQKLSANPRRRSASADVKFCVLMLAPVRFSGWLRVWGEADSCSVCVWDGRGL
jgi:hypothetical protein